MNAAKKVFAFSFWLHSHLKAGQNMQPKMSVLLLQYKTIFDLILVELSVIVTCCCQS